jgi:hypothetical protein
MQQWARDQRRGARTVELFPDLKPAPRRRNATTGQEEMPL